MSGFDLPPDDQPDVIDIGPVDSIPVFHEDDPRIQDDLQATSRARSKVQSLDTIEALIAALEDSDWRVRLEAIPRLVARFRTDSRTQAALIETLDRDSDARIRDTVAFILSSFSGDDVLSALQHALYDESDDVRASALLALEQLAEG